MSEPDPPIEERTVMIRYLGGDVVDIPGVGVFQQGTQATVPRSLAFDLLQSDDWAAVGQAQPAVQLVVNVGQWDGPAPPPGDPAASALRPSNPEDFGDLPAEGPEPLDAG